MIRVCYKHTNVRQIYLHISQYMARPCHMQMPPPASTVQLSYWDIILPQPHSPTVLWEMNVANVPKGNSSGSFNICSISQLRDNAFVYRWGLWINPFTPCHADVPSFPWTWHLMPSRDKSLVSSGVKLF